MSDVLVHRDGPVLHLTLNRPAQRNAMSIGMVQALREALTAAEADGQTRVVVLRGAGGHFCAGGDIRDMAAARGDSAAIVQLSAAFGDLCVAFSQTGLATVAVLEGTVMGGGFGLACVVDVALAGESVAFRLPETSLGLSPAQIGPFLVERLGLSEARRLAVTGARLGGTEALALRLVHELHRDLALDAALARVLKDILQCAPGAVAATKALLARARLHTPASLVHEAAEAFAAAVASDEGAEGTAAFVGKRPARWVPTP
ncbi:MAG: enoyl-CoA hydratase/isomerase family protein [Rubrivivax sp.]|nr:enoyl-CoA hydratase/isomerase family protein [Rubrivivax sp.]